MNRKPVVSVCVISYRPKEDALFKTLDSILKQKNIDVQIVISDDGSDNNKFREIQEYLDNVGFYTYKLTALEKNQGTVQNVEQALRVANGRYIKLISPGDCLCEENILAEWVNHLRNSGKKWSFSDAKFYTKDNQGECVISSYGAFPQCVRVYTGARESECRWNYVILDDIALGAATLCERELMLQYMQEIAGKVKYGEDNCYRLMVFDGYVPSYFPKEAVLYEYGTGVSTSRSEVWDKRLQDDWMATVSIILARTTEENLQRKMQRILKSRDSGNIIQKKIRHYLEKGRIRLVLEKRYHRRMSGYEGGTQRCR